MENKDIIKIALNALNDKKALDLVLIEISKLTVVADYFILATATSSTHVKTLAEEVYEKLSKAGLKPNHVEGKSTDWILVDYGSVIVHVFGQASREFYSLDKMWNDGERIDITPYLELGAEGR